MREDALLRAYGLDPEAIGRPLPAPETARPSRMPQDPPTSPLSLYVVADPPDDDDAPELVAWRPRPRSA